MGIQNRYDVVIIGGAVMGSSAAFWLSRMDPDLRVLVVEPDPGYSRSSTALSVASIRQQFTTSVNVKISRFGIEFIKNINSYLGQGGDVASLGFQENGYLFLAGNTTSEVTMREACEMQREHGAQTKLLSPEALKARFDWLNVDDIRLASFGLRDEGWFDNMSLLGGLKKAAIAQGVSYIKDRVVALDHDTGQIKTVILAGFGEISAGHVINSAGTSANDIMQMLGNGLPVEPRKRTVFMIDAPNAIHPDAPLMVCHSGFYLRPEHKHWICAIVPEDDHIADPDDFEPDLVMFEDVIWPKLYERAPGFDAVKVLSAWAGHYAYNTLDQNAIIGAHPNWRNLYLMNGFSGHGLQQAPAVGRGIAELILSGAYQTIDLSDLSVERILDGKPFYEKAIV
ncbi:MAG: FAD-binding oxidoreductase [Marinosulfonomonas sp.]|nr:FAD-binding oxidoreductase [Marinosulfonomonas sp.]